MIGVDVTIWFEENTFGNHINSRSQGKQSIDISIVFPVKFGQVVFSHVVTCPHVSKNEWSPAPELNFAEDCTPTVRQCKPLQAWDGFLVVLTQLLYWHDDLPAIVSELVFGFGFWLWLTFGCLFLIVSCEIKIFDLELHLFEKIIQIPFMLLNVPKIVNASLAYSLITHFFKIKLIWTKFIKFTKLIIKKMIFIHWKKMNWRFYLIVSWL